MGGLLLLLLLLLAGGTGKEGGKTGLRMGRLGRGNGLDWGKKRGGEGVSLREKIASG